MEFKVGDRVMLREDSYFANNKVYADSNPLGVYGIIINLGDKNHVDTYVEWDDGSMNTYRWMDLDNIEYLKQKAFDKTILEILQED